MKDIIIEYSIMFLLLSWPGTIIATMLYFAVWVPISNLVHFLTYDISEPEHGFLDDSCVDGCCDCYCHHRQQQKNEYIYNYDDDNYKY